MATVFVRSVNVYRDLPFQAELPFVDAAVGSVPFGLGAGKTIGRLAPPHSPVGVAVAKRFLLIANPASGSPPRAGLREQALAGLQAGGEVELLVTERAGHAIQIARETDLARYDALCVLGGDGTAHEVVTGLMQRPDPARMPLGLIPGGTGNSVCLHLGVGDVRMALPRILAGHTRPVDVLRVQAGGDTHYCLNLVGWAAGCEITRTAERWRLLGRVRYAAAALWHVLTARPRPARLILDDELHDDEFLLVLACNTRHVGSGMLAAPRADLGDGLLDVVVVRRASRWRLLALLRRVYDGTHIQMPEVEYHQVRSLRIETAGPEPLNLDGEVKGRTPLAAEVLPGAIQMLA
jgi:diacylglycerol kinase (ATP)